jgi:hypothetical protein
MLLAQATAAVADAKDTQVSDFDNVRVASVMEKMKTPPGLVPSDNRSSMFIDLSNTSDKNKGEVTKRLDKVAKGWEKELKRLTEAYSAKKKLKKVGSFAEWSCFILKHTLLLSDMDSLHCYVEFIFIVNKLNRAKG